MDLCGEGGGASLYCLWCPISNILYLNFHHLLNSFSNQKNIVAIKQKHKVCNGETFRRFFYNAKPVNKIAFLILYVVVRNTTPHFTSSQSLSKVLHNQQLQHPFVSL